MSLFQTSVLKKYLKQVDRKKADSAFEIFTAYFHNPARQENIRKANEEQFQEGFLRELFVKVFGYTLNPEPDYDLTTEFKNLKGAKKADGAILQDGKAIGVIELKGTDTTDLDKVETQAFGYKNHQPNAVYVITSNFEKLRFYIDNAVDFEEFNLFTLTKERFDLLWLCVAKENVFNGLPKRIKTDSVMEEENVTKKLYKDYSAFKRDIFQSIVEKNPDFDKLLLFKKTQKLLDRFLFLFFAEDRLLLPPNSIRKIIDQWTDLRDKYDEYFPLYDRFKKYFGYLNTGHKGTQHEIFAYNGGLFAADEVLDNIEIADDLLYSHSLKLSQYDFESEVSVNILGHIFEHSLNEIEEITAELEGQAVDKSKTKRKKDGVFYTPKYITKYIVENTVGKLCEEKKAELQIIEEEYHKDRKRRKKDTLKKLDKRLKDYREWLLGLTICDPACGSGAFLNQALEFLIAEHRYIDELNAKLFEREGENLMVFQDVSNDILENNLYGVDINEESVEIAKLSLWLRTAQKGRKLTMLNNNIKCGNSLIDDPEVAGEKAFKWEEEFPHVFDNGGFDVVIGNPPYVQSHSINDNEKDYYYNHFSTAEYQVNLYGLFIEKTLNILNVDCRYSLIIPNYWLSTKYDSELRKKVFLENKADILLNTYEVFEGATVDTLILVGKKSNQKFPKKTRVISISSAYKSIEERLNSISIGIWDFNKDYEFNSLFDDVSISFDTKLSLKGDKNLSHFFEMYQGMKPYEKGKGSPPQTREMMNSKVYHSSENMGEDYLILIGARNVKRYLCRKENQFIKYGKNLAAPRKIEIFSGERILLNRIISKEKIEGVYVEETIINNTDVFNLIPHENIPIKIKAMLAIITSKLCAVFFKKSNINLNRNAFPKINVNTLESFPIPEISSKYQEQLEYLANEMLILHSQLYSLSIKLQKLLIRRFEIEKLSKNLQNWHNLLFADFLKELKKKKIKISLSEEAEWEEYFETEKAEAQAIQKKIHKTDRVIDEMVYELYGLTEEEIAIVESS